MLKVNKIKPVSNHIVTTMEIYSEAEVKSITGLVDASKLNTIKEYQKVIAVGPYVKDIKEGDIVRINPSRYIQILHKQGRLSDIDKKTVTDEMHSAVDIPRELLYTKGEDGVETSQWVLILYDSDIMFVAEGEEFKPSPLTTAQKPLIVPPGGVIKS